MDNFVAILEDNPGRLAEMRSCLAELLPQIKHEFFDNADEMIAWLADHVGQVVLISLDHDLPLRQVREGVQVDAGSGRMVADFLCGFDPTCPVIVHSSNENFAPGMLRVLRDAGWTYRRVYPFDEHKWVRTAWTQAIKHFIESGWVFEIDTPQQ